MKKVVWTCLLGIIISSSFLLFFGEIQKVSAAQTLFDRPLMIGSQGEDVRTLQKILNENPVTRIQGTGPGSPGKETSYFGSLTQNAVIRFQDKYANEILAPAGLTQGNGYVGYYTMDKLNALSALTMGSTYPSTTSSINILTSTAVLPSMFPDSTTVSQNPNMKNIGIAMADLDRVAAEQGLSSTTLAALKQQIMNRAATTTDLRATFLRLVQGNSLQAIGDDSFFGKVLAMVGRAFNTVFMPEYAEAAVGMPFGGKLLFATPCDGGVWNIILEPLPPSYAFLLSYVSGSEAFLSHNIPFTNELLGEYYPAINEACWVGIYPYPAEGLISPITGSSPT